MNIIQTYNSIRNDSIWGISTKSVTCLLYLEILFGIFIFSVSVYSTDYYKFLIREDGIIEYSSALFWLLAAITTIQIIFSLNKQNRILLICYILFFFFFIICLGEEISWGQRIFHFKGADIIISINKQQEFNIHDIGHISIFSNLFFLMFICFYFIYPWISIRNKKLKKIIIENSLPIVSGQTINIAIITIVIWLIVGIRYGTLGFHPYSLFGYYTQMDDEIFELLAAYSYWCFALSDLNIKRVISL
jgi:hypothetical protein